MKKFFNTQPVLRVGIGGKVFQLYVEDTYSFHDGDNRSGILFRTLTGMKFFCPFEKLTFL